MDYTYRRLSSHDVASLDALRTVFQAAFLEEQRWSAAPPNDAYLQQVLSHDSYIALVAEDGAGEVVGGLIAHVLPKIDRVHSEIYLYDLAVAETHRRWGIATKLIELLKAEGRAYQASTVFVQADNEDAAAVALYTRLADSIERDITHFDFIIEDGSGEAV